MRRIISFLLILMALVANARQITPEEAQSIASGFFNSKAKKTSRSAVRAIGETESNTGNQPYYIFNAEDKPGFIIISGDTRAKRILGYSDKGSFNTDNIPSQLSWLLGEYEKQITALPASASQDESWQNEEASSSEGILLETVNWGQGYPYNTLCPIIDGAQAPAGCVATAMAIVMKYHNWPEQGNGRHTNFFNRDLEFDFGNYKPDWEIMSDEFNLEELSSDQVYEISRLCFSAGVAVDMCYGSVESGSDALFVGNTMSSRFNFAPNSTVERGNYSSAEWTDMIITEINNNRPILYYGFGDGGGHMFVVDGYSSDSLVHINWGWDGAMNGYFSLPDLNVNELDFSNDQRMIIGLEPNQSNVRYSSFMVNDGVGRFADVKTDGYNFTTNLIRTNEEFGAVLPYVYGDYEMNGMIGLAVIDSESNIIELVGNYNGINNPSIKYLETDGIVHQLGYGCEQIWSFECGNYKLQKNLYAYHLHNLKIDTEIQPGYKLQLIGRDSPDSDWEFIIGTPDISTCIDLTEEVRSEWCEIQFDYDDSLISIMGTDDYSNGLHAALKDGIARYDICTGGAGDVTAEYSGNMTWFGPDFYAQGNYNENYHGTAAFFVENENFCKLTITESSSDYSDRTLNSNEIEVDGIVYAIADKKIGDFEAETYACITGYTNNCEETIHVKDSVTIHGAKYPVRVIAAGAFKGNDKVRFVDLSSSNLYSLNSSLSFLNNIEAITINSENDPGYGAELLHKSSIIKNVYELGDYCSAYGTGTKQVSEFVYQTLADVYRMNEVFPDWYIAAPRKHLRNPQGVLYYSGDLTNPTPPRFFVPGAFVHPKGNGIGSNVYEMWRYELDNDGRRVYVKPLIEGLEIDEVLINGEKAVGSNDIYQLENAAESAALNDNVDIDVVVNYTLHGRQEMSTHYTPEFNSEVNRTQIDDLVTWIEEISSFEETEIVRIYNITGILVFKGKFYEANLDKGIYVIVSKDKTHKLLIN